MVVEKTIPLTEWALSYASKHPSFTKAVDNTIAPAALDAITKIVIVVFGYLTLRLAGITVVDLWTGESRAVEISKDETIQAILDDDSLTAEQKEDAIVNYLTSKETDIGDIINKILIFGTIGALAYTVVKLK